MSLFIKRKKKVLVYCRHSREHAQENSIPIQLERLEKYAEENGLEIIHTEKDEGESGLTADRPGFQSLLNDWAKHPERTKLFEGVLFLDVSRMGRFQKLSQFGLYTSILDQHNKWVWFVELGMLPEKQDSMHHLMIAVKQIAASDYSAKLSDRVWHGSVRISGQGYSVGGSPCYGMERILLDEQRKFICVLQDGEKKQISNQRVSFRPRYDQTTETVREIFHLFVEREFLPEQIAGYLNQRQIASAKGRKWRSSAILRILKNEVYIGTRVYNKTWQQLGALHRRMNPRSEWIIKTQAFPASIEPAIFFTAQKRLRLILPNLRYKGARLIKAVEEQLISEITELLHEGKVADQIQKSGQTTFPLIFSIRENEPQGNQWHFLLPESLRVFDTVIGVGLVFDHKTAVERLFAIPTPDFGLHNVLAFPLHSEQENSYLVDKEQAQKKLLALMSK